MPDWRPRLQWDYTMISRPLLRHLSFPFGKALPRPKRSSRNALDLTMLTAHRLLLTLLHHAATGRKSPFVRHLFC
ncbi:MAG: hypothetical protein WD645_01095, partial [Dehalococcoidia bacterium]